mmetsp:Transcript_119135/g.207365  ORF Transcript_119135/g.207365 Transcript_119135/m.207365 type:complete len:218 (-) Transcript_119135:217-870(-)
MRQAWPVMDNKPCSQYSERTVTVSMAKSLSAPCRSSFRLSRNSSVSSTSACTLQIVISAGTATVRNGIRQPQSVICCAVRHDRSPWIAELATSIPRVLPKLIIVAANPLICLGLASTKKMLTVPNSPPVDRPWPMRQSIRQVVPRTGSRGISPCPTVEMAIRDTDPSIAGFRPNLSDKIPKRRPPRGRATNVVPYPSQAPREDPPKKFSASSGSTKA